jgi:hypothetical protein
MPRKKRNARDNSADASSAAISDARLIARLLAMLLVKGMVLGEQADTLVRTGLTPTEIALMLGTTPESVRQQAYVWRKERRSARTTRNN